MARKHKPTNQATNTILLSNEAMDYFGLDQQPFTDGILSADAIYTDATLDQLVDTLKHHLQFSDLILIVEGDLGSGKTTLFRRLIQSEADNLFQMNLHAEATDTLVQIQQKMSIHLKDQGNANYLDENLKNLKVFDQTPVIIIDDAHVLSDTTLQELIRYQKQLETEQQVQLKILLLANKGMAKTIEDISDLQRSQLFIQEMPALTEKQIGAFIQHKFSLAGYNQVSQLDDDSLQQIFKKSLGQPGQVMQQAVIQLEKITRKNTRKALFSFSPKPVYLLAAALLVAAVAIAAYLLSTPTPEQITTPTAVIPQPVIQQPAKQQTALPADTVIAETDETASDETPAQIDETADPIIEQAASDSLTQPEQPPVETTAPAETVEDVTSAIATPPQPPAPAIPAQPVTVKTITTRTVTPAAPAEPIKAEQPASQPATEPEIEVIVATKPAPSQPVVLVKLSPGIEKLSSLGIRDADWLKQQNPNHWTLQVLGARDPETLVKFIMHNKLGDDTAWYETSLTGKPWYVLVHRFYTDKEIARKSIARLPASLQKTRPWVKSVASIHQAIQP